ncbi:hypothetical protein HWV62_33958 [Athelia sp. TMB]|nr:hypothetical protein HWV62_33958 [Athelia sp. TMB]
MNCKQVGLWRQVLLVANQIHMLNQAVILAVRMYALYARDRRIIWLFAFLGISTIVIVSVRLAVPWECVFVLDTIVLSLTVFKARLAIRKSSVRPSANAIHIPTLKIRDGALYFAGMALTNLLNIMCFYVAPPLMKDSESQLTLSASSIGVTLISRVVLNLREIADASRSSPNLETISQPKWTSGARSHPRSSYTSKTGTPRVITGKVTSEPGWEMRMKVMDISAVQEYPNLEMQEF